ncbi:MAG: hypothetical protein ACFB16_17700 [Phormidesmis sp.]
MTDDRRKPLANVNPNYAASQLDKALETSQTHSDAETQARARKRAGKWQKVLENILTGEIEYGSKTPIEGIPLWATLEIVTGGFATGELSAGGPLQAHEQAILSRLPTPPAGEERHAINTYFLSESGSAELWQWLDSGTYRIAFPEEGALMVVAWLIEQGEVERATNLLQTIAPYFSRIRFYPIWDEVPQKGGARVHVQTVKNALQRIEQIKPNKRVLAQKEAVEVWLPLYDRMVALFLEIEQDLPQLRYSQAWRNRALALTKEYAQLRKQHRLSAKMERTGHHSTQLRKLLKKCARSPILVSKKDIRRIQLILKRYQEKRSAPNSEQCIAARRRQIADVSAPMFYKIAPVIASRLSMCHPNNGIDDIRPFIHPVDRTEADRFDVPPSTSIPDTIQRKVERCLNETVEALVERKIITSGETLASVLPQMTADIRALGIVDYSLRQLYASIYRAFRQRRSLLLLTLEKQVQLEDLPWIAAIEPFRSDQLSSQATAKQTLIEVVTLTLIAFPHAIFPNKLIQEFQALVKSAHLDIPLVNELAADIFIGSFSENFLSAAQQAADLLQGSLYETYYAIDYTTIQQTLQLWRGRAFFRENKKISDEFTRLCAKRAGVSKPGWTPAINGMIIEQQQIITTQNLAALLTGLELIDQLRSQLPLWIDQCFQWICKRQQVNVSTWHAQLINLKNTAYAWRQMIFFLSLLPEETVDACLQSMNAHLCEQDPAFESRFRPALAGLILARQQYPTGTFSRNKDLFDSSQAKTINARRFLGWSNTKHWLMAE